MVTLTSKAMRVFSIMLVLYLCLEYTNGRTIDEIIASSSKNATSFDMIRDEYGAVLKLELDMLLTVDQYLALYGNQNTFNSAGSQTPKRNKRKATKSLLTRWPNKRIPYRIAPYTFSNREIGEIRLAIEEWETYTCIKFQSATISDSNFIHFKDGSGCSSYIGMTRGEQTVSLADGCREKGIIAHEIGHAVGFFHEQNRPDRDDYIIIKKENILHPDLYDNFKKYDWSAVSSYDVPYDYTSIMHYGGTAFSSNGQYTIVTKDPEYQTVIGNRNGLSFSDIKLANLMYNCSQTCRSPVTCPAGGFLGKDCQCWCPGDPVKQCLTGRATQSPFVKSTARPIVRSTMRPTYRLTTETKTCTDMNPNCPEWQSSGFCQSSSYVKTYCLASCGMCTGGSQIKPPCQDFRNYCPLWGKRGYCSGSLASFMESKCPATCGVCRKQQTLAPGMKMRPNTDSTVGSEKVKNTNNVDNTGMASGSSSFLAMLFSIVISFVYMF